jgi:hypothetical protein
MPALKSLIGNKYGRLTVIERAEDVVYTNGRKRVAWKCRCECGQLCVVDSFCLTGGKTKSCGCLRIEKTVERSTKHNGKRDRLYSVWVDMKKRCYNPNYKQYKDYGGRGIRVCDEWLHNYSAFRGFALQNGYNPTAKYGETTIDRIDADGDYAPHNCRFVDMKAQNNNKRRKQ